MVMEGDLTWGGEHTTQSTDDVLWNCASETCNFVNQCHPNKFSKKEKKSHCVGLRLGS